MISVEQIIAEAVKEALKQLWGASDDAGKQIQVQKTRKEFTGDYTVVVFPFLKYSKNTPDATAQFLGDELMKKTDLLDSFNVIKGFRITSYNVCYTKLLRAVIYMIPCFANG